MAGSASDAARIIGAVHRAQVRVLSQRYDLSEYEVAMGEAAIDALKWAFDPCHADPTGPVDWTVRGVKLVLDERLPENVIEMRHVIREEF